MKLVRCMILSLGLWLCSSGLFCAQGQGREVVTTTPVLEDGVLYVATSEPAIGRGHLRAIDLLETFPITLWDAAKNMPMAGSDLSQPAEISIDNQKRTTLTNLNRQLVPLAANLADRLMARLDVASITEAEMLLHAVRGRRGGSLDLPAGFREEPYRLWSISRSSPVMTGRNLINPRAAARDRTLYVGAEDGQLHAFHVSRWDSEENGYPLRDIDGGKELWSYLPGSFLSYLKDQPLGGASGDSVLHLDGTPVIREVYCDLNGDGSRNWHTLLTATGTILAEKKSSLFVLDVTDPYRPELLWEKLLPGNGVGRTRGVLVNGCPDRKSECVYLSADFGATKQMAGFHLMAMDLLTGDLLWQTKKSYPASGVVVKAVPAIPALIDLDGNQLPDHLAFGDLAGQLWILNLKTGQVPGGQPVYVVPGGFHEPIGASVAVHGRMVVFGTGGVAGSSDQFQYALYKVEITPEGGHLLWRFPLDKGEKVWDSPLLDARGNLVFATAVNYDTLLQDDQVPGRIVALDKRGEITAEHETGSGIVSKIVSAPGVVITVALTGETVQYGTASRINGPGAEMGSVRILSWRQR